jgi:hypothetical protein
MLFAWTKLVWHMAQMRMPCSFGCYRSHAAAVMMTQPTICTRQDTLLITSARSRDEKERERQTEAERERKASKQERKVSKKEKEKKQERERTKRTRRGEKE